MRGNRLVTRALLVVAMGTAAYAATPKRAAAATQTSNCQPGCVPGDLCTAAFCFTACGYVGEGANCTPDERCGSTEFWLDCGAES
jgi:hypothetical protein